MQIVIPLGEFAQIFEEALGNNVIPDGLEIVEVTTENRNGGIALIIECKKETRQR